MGEFNHEQIANSTDEVAKLWEENAPLWTRLSRAGYDTYRDTHNTPIFLANLPDITGLSGLDIGCGEGTNTRQVAVRGASIIAIDVAPSFIAAAQAAERDAPLGITYQQADATALPFADEEFDFATSFMCMMDIAHVEKAVHEAFRVLRRGGFFHFSILHPCFAPPSRKVIYSDAGEPLAIEISDYFNATDGVVEEWVYGTAVAAGEEITQPFKVPRFHRTLSQWMTLLLGTGFTLEHLAEPKATKAQAEEFPNVADTLIVPLFLHIRVRKL